MFLLKQGSYKLILGSLLFVVLWSSGWIGSKYGQEFAGPITLLAYRYALVVVVLIAIVYFTRSWRKLSAVQLASHGCIGILSHAVYCGFANSAMTMGVSAGTVAFTAALMPAITAVLSPAIAGERTSHRQWIGLVLGFSAVLLVISDKLVPGSSAYGFILPFLALLALSVAAVLDRRISLKQRAARSEPIPLPLICLIHCSSSLLVLVPAAGILEGYRIQWGIEVIFSIFWLAILVSLFAYGLLFYLLRHLSATRVASLEYLAPPTTMLMAFYIFGEYLSLTDCLGLLLAAFAVWLIVSESGKFKRKGQLAEAGLPDTHSQTERLLPSQGVNSDNATVSATSPLYRQSRKYRVKVSRFSRGRELQLDNLKVRRASAVRVKVGTIRHAINSN